MICNYQPQRSWAKVIFSQACVCPQGGSASVHAGIYPPLTRPPRDQTPPAPDPPGTRPPLAPDPPRHQPPREADSSIRSTSGRYASYWNAFLFVQVFCFCVRLTQVVSFSNTTPRHISTSQLLKLVYWRKANLFAGSSRVSWIIYGNQGQTMMDLKSSKIINQPKWVLYLKICPKLQDKQW